MLSVRFVVCIFVAFDSFVSALMLSVVSFVVSLFVALDSVVNALGSALSLKIASRCRC